jgi:hypothetical protein
VAAKVTEASASNRMIVAAVLGYCPASTTVGRVGHSNWTTTLGRPGGAGWISRI